MPDLVFGPSPAGLLLTGVRLLGSLPSTEANNARYMQLRSTPEYRAAETARRGEATRAQLVASTSRYSLGLQAGEVGGRPTATPPPGTVQGVPPISIGPSQLPVLGLPPGVLPGLMGQTATSTQGVGIGSSRASSVPMRYGDFDWMLEKLPRGLARRLGSIATAAVKGGLAFELVRRALEDVIFGLDPDELTPDQVRDAERRFREAVESLKRVTVGRKRIIPTDKRGLGGDIVVNRRTRSGGPPPPSWEQLPPGATQPGKAPNPTETIFVRARRLLRDNLQSIVLGAIGLGSLSLLRRERAASPLTVNIPQAAVAPLPTPTTDTLPQPLTLVQSAGLSSTSTRTCECKAKKKRDKRKCLERAQVEWRSGRYKGKLAGTKCVRFAKG